MWPQHVYENVSENTEEQSVSILRTMTSLWRSMFPLQLAEVYGNIFGLRLGRDNIVFLNGYKIIREALVVQGENFVDRPYSPTVARVYAGNSK